MLGLAAVPALILFLGFRFYLPESPRWLALQGHTEKALSVLKSLRDSDAEAVEELNGILQSVELHQRNGNTDYGNTDHVRTNGASVDANNDTCSDSQETETVEYGSTSRADALMSVLPNVHQPESASGHFCRMVSDKPTRRALVLGCGLMIVQQFCGINTYVLFCYGIAFTYPESSI